LNSGTVRQLLRSIAERRLTHELGGVLGRLAALALVALAVSSASLLTAGCGSTSTFIMEAYPGPVRPANTIAVVRVDGASAVEVLALDGEPLVPLSPDTRLHIEVLPGRHTLLARNRMSPGGEAEPQAVAFDARAGKFYRVSFVGGSSAFGPLEARAFELDPQTGASGLDVTAVEPAAPPAPRKTPPARAPILGPSGTPSAAPAASDAAPGPSDSSPPSASPPQGKAPPSPAPTE
jgi:hypothetical protein